MYLNLEKFPSSFMTEVVIKLRSSQFRSSDGSNCEANQRRKRRSIKLSNMSRDHAMER
jgi:hypothetical protein